MSVVVVLSLLASCGRDEPQGAQQGDGGLEPCSGKACGATCEACGGGELGCGVLGYCGADGSCRLPFPVCPPPEQCADGGDCPQIASCMVCSDGSSSCPTGRCVEGQCTTWFPECPTECEAPEDCPDLGMPCQECPDGTIACPGFDCVGGQCLARYGGCAYDPCANEECGQACTVCDPADPNCTETAVLKFCDADGVCRPSFPECPSPAACTMDADCPGVGACPPCPSDQCAELRCVAGECRFTCADAERCDLPMDPGPCDAAIPRYWFDHAADKCTPFSYGGCEGNANNFETARECVETCTASSSDPCGAITCDTGSSCVYLGNDPRCATDCGPNGECTGGLVCGCGGSCPACEDCRQVCVPAP